MFAHNGFFKWNVMKKNISKLLYELRHNIKDTKCLQSYPSNFLFYN